MNGPIAQLVALTCHGNAAVVGNAAGRFFPDNSTCGYCDSVTFVSLKASPSGSDEVLVASTPDEWFVRLRNANAVGIRLVGVPRNDPLISDRMSAGFVGGGGDWQMEVLLPDRTSEIWMARWTVWNRDAPEQRIWRVTYGLLGNRATSQAPAADLARITEKFRNALQQIHAFSERQQCGDFFTTSFKSSLDCLADRRACAGYHGDLSVAGTIPREAVSVLQAAQTAWVFGGMGSWNDMMFEGKAQTEYEKVSDQLFNVLREAIPAAANSSLRNDGGPAELSAR